MLANSPKNDRLSTAEPCALYYFPEIPSAAKRETSTVSHTHFNSGPFKCNQKPVSHEEGRQDPEQIRCMIEEAFNKGMEQGRAESIGLQEEQVKNAVAAFEAGVQELYRVRQLDLESMESATVRLALAITKKIVGYETEHSQVIHHVVKQAMAKVNDSRQLVIKLNPKDLAAVQDRQHELLPNDDLGVVFRIEADDGIQCGGCVIETKLGDVDARIDSQLKIIEQLLVDQIPKPTNQG